MHTYLTNSSVAPAAVNQEQPLQKSELSEAIVRIIHRLGTLQSMNAHPDVSRLYSETNSHP